MSDQKVFLLRLSRGWSLYHRVGLNGEVVPELVYKTRHHRPLSDLLKHPRLRSLCLKKVTAWLASHEDIGREKKPDPFHVRALTGARNALSVLS